MLQKQSNVTLFMTQRNDAHATGIIGLGKLFTCVDTIRLGSGGHLGVETPLLCVVKIPGRCERCQQSLRRNGRFYLNDGERQLCGPCYLEWLRQEEQNYENGIHAVLAE